MIWKPLYKTHGMGDCPSRFYRVMEIKRQAGMDCMIPIYTGCLPEIKKYTKLTINGLSVLCISYSLNYKVANICRVSSGRESNSVETSHLSMWVVESPGFNGKSGARLSSSTNLSPQYISALQLLSG